MTLRTLAMVAALWLACAASALAQTNIYNGTRDGGEQPSTGENNGCNTGTDQPVDPGTGGDTPVQVTTMEIATAEDLQKAFEKGCDINGTSYVLKSFIVIESAFHVENSLKLDLNGHTIGSINGNPITINENITLVLVDLSNHESIGQIFCNSSEGGYTITINSDAKLIADGVTITCSDGTAIFNNGGSAEINNCSVSGYTCISNKGTLSVNGGTISGIDTAIKNAGGKISVNSGENPAACTIGGGNYGIFNGDGCEVTLGSGVSIGDYSVSGIYHNGSNFFLNALPTFTSGSTAGVSDICLFNGSKLSIGSAITAAPAKKITVRATDINSNDLTADALPATFTSGYASHVIDGSSNVIDPAEVFTYYDSSAGFAVLLTVDGSSAEATLIDPANPPVGANVTSILSPTVDANDELTWEFEMPDYDVLVTVFYEDDPNVVTFTFAEGQEWMTWCSEASFKKPDGIDAYTIDDATAAAITVTPITASDASQPAVLPAYTPLLLRKNGYEGLTAEQYAVPTAPTDDLFKDYGIVSQATTDCTVYGSTKAVTDAASSQVFALGRTYMLKSGEFVAVDQFDGIAANRCWLTLSVTPAASRLLIRTGDATDIRTVGPGPAPSDDHWYSLTGIRLEKRPDRKGIYLNGGKKVIIK